MKGNDIMKWEVDIRSRKDGESIETIFSGCHDDACQIMNSWYNNHGMDIKKDLESYVDGTDGIFADLYIAD